MSKTIVVCGHGPGISDAVARKFGAEGYNVALVARTADKLATAAKAIAGEGIKCEPFVADLADAAAVVAMIGKVRAAFGPIDVVHYNAYAGGDGNILSTSPEGLRRSFDVSVTGLVAAVQASYADLVASKGAVLVTGGGFAFYDARVDAMVAQFNAADLAIGKAAQHKLVGVLAAKLAGDGVYVGEVVVTGMVKGTAFDQGNAPLDPKDIAARFWEIYKARTTQSVNFG
ncbi:MAG: SDR family NAD(P)-dependent oxidoreductase [Myxococcales bacterium]|nr:SDR family NAD(P)-dependent oxidoreductase [Myxococcales bacterium]